MKTTVFSILIASAGLSFAGEAPAPKQAIVPVADIPNVSGCPDCLAFSGLFVGAGVDYLIQSDAVFYNGRIGYEWGAASRGYSQAVFLEGGWLDSDEDFVSLEAIPITLNYEYRRALTSCLNIYVGGGAGIAFIDTAIAPDRLKPTELIQDDDVVFVGQVFAGLTYCFTENVELYAGLRYIWSADFGSGSSEENFSDLSVGGGLRVKF